MKKVLLAIVLASTFTTTYAASNLGEDLGFQDCKENLQDSRQADIEDIRVDIQANDTASSTNQ